MWGKKMGADLESKHATATNRLPDFPARLSKLMGSVVLLIVPELIDNRRGGAVN